MKNEPKQLKRITRRKPLSKKQAAKYKAIRKQVANELPELIERHHKRMDKKSLPEVIDCTRGASGQNPIVWMIWFINDKNLVGVYSIASTNKLATGYRKLCLAQRGVIRSWIEKREIDHLFGAVDMIQAFNLDRTQIHALAKEFPLDSV